MSKQQKIKELKAKRAQLTVELRAAKEAEQIAMNRPDEYWTAIAKDIIKRMWGEWAAAKAWSDSVTRSVETTLQAVSPIGMVRHLDAAAHASEAVIAAMKRRGPNSAIQGLSSQIGFVAMRAAAEENWLTLKSQGLPSAIRATNAVHDSSLNEMIAEMLPAAIYIVEHSMTTLAMEHYKDTYGFDMRANVPISFDFELGFNEGEMFGWKDLRFDTLGDWLEPRLKEAGVGKRIRANTMHNLRAIEKVRLHELRKDPYRMTLRGDTSFYRNNFKLSQTDEKY